MVFGFHLLVELDSGSISYPSQLGPLTFPRLKTDRDVLLIHGVELDSGLCLNSMALRLSGHLPVFT